MLKPAQISKSSSILIKNILNRTNKLLRVPLPASSSFHCHKNQSNSSLKNVKFITTITTPKRTFLTNLVGASPQSPSQSSNKELTKLLNKAEKIVGYGTSFLSLRYLVSDEVANFAKLLRKLMQTKHPLIKLARQIFDFNSNPKSSDLKRTMQINGLIVLLIAKAAGSPQTNQASQLLSGDFAEGIHVSQRYLAEITEMIHMASLIHKGVLDLSRIEDNISDNSKINNEMDQGNKLAVLCGDYLLANACKNLSKLQNCQVVSLMSDVIGEISEGLFQSDVEKLTSLKQWYTNQNSNSTSLLVNSAKSAMLLVKHSSHLQEVASSFAQHLDLTHKIWSDLIEFKSDPSALKRPETILNAIYRDKLNLLDTKQQSSAKGYSESEISDFAFDESKFLLNKHYDLAMRDLDRMESEHSEMEAISSLKSILNLMKESV